MNSKENFDETANLPEYKPRIFNYESDKDIIDTLIREGKILETNDHYTEQEAELFDLLGSTGTKPKKEDDNQHKGKWVFFPWKKKIVHILVKDDFLKLLTSRNSFLITGDEQRKFSESRIGFAGLNVGNPGALCITHEGGGSNMKFADFDKLSLSNLNRFNAGIAELGLNKAIITARQAYEVNPYVEIELFSDGIKPDSIENFLLKPKLDLLIEEMDNLQLKISIRMLAKKFRIPVIMVTADGIIDVERYDREKDLEILSGNLDKAVINKINSPEIMKSSPKERAFIARDFIGKEFHSERLNEAFEYIGKVIPSIPQLAEWTYLRGALLGHFARKILIGESVPSGRYLFPLEGIIKTK
jgi:hypothetical protein